MTPPPDRLARRLGLGSAIAVLVGSTIGSGIFRVPAGIASQLGDPPTMLLAWVLGGLIALAGALTIAELAAALPRSGGIFAWLLEAYGPLPAFLFGWSELVVIRASALGAIATIFAEYLGKFVALSGAEVRYVAAAAVAFVGATNYVGVNVAALVINATTWAKYLALFGIAALALVAGQGDASHFAPAATTPALPVIGAALVAILWTYDGWADLGFVAGEVKEPGRTLPRALILGTALIVVIYLLVNVAFLWVLPAPVMGASKLVAASAAERIPALGAQGASIIAAVVMVSCYGSLNGSMLTGPRIFFAMAEQGLFFRSIARVSPRFGTPSTAIALATVLGVGYVLLNDFQRLADAFILGIWPFYALAVLAVPVLRRAQPGLARPYRALGYPVIPLLFLAASVGMIASAFVTDPRGTGVTFGIIALGVPVYALWRARARRKGSVTPAPIA